MKAGQITGRGRIELVDAGSASAGGRAKSFVALETGCLCGSDIPYFSEAHDRYPLAPWPVAARDRRHDCRKRQPAFSQGGSRARDADRPARALRAPHHRRRPAGELDDGARQRRPPFSRSRWPPSLSALSTLPGLIGKTVAVVGQGPIGLLFNLCLSRLGAARIIGIDALDERASRSCQFGATDSISAGRVDPVEAVRELTGGAMADLVVEAVGHEEQALNLLHRPLPRQRTLALLRRPARSIERRRLEQPRSGSG